MLMGACLLDAALNNGRYTVPSQVIKPKERVINCRTYNRRRFSGFPKASVHKLIGKFRIWALVSIYASEFGDIDFLLRVIFNRVEALTLMASWQHL